ncbi:MAG: biotin--[acetyl-CoA-carboxylase] ligase [Rikenellaceae bacterium]
MIYRFDSLGSTNDQAQDEVYSHGDIIVAERQSAGRGQRGNKWISGQGLNLTLSAVVCPQGLELRRQFLLSQASALAICDVLRANGLSPRIKWTNDIYIGDKKIVGILIENQLSGAKLVRSVVGIGLNINQVEFDESLPNPTSMRAELGREVDREQVLLQMEEALLRRYSMLNSGAFDQISSEYRASMYRLSEEHPFRLKSGEIKLGTIVGVESSGELIIDWAEDQRGAYMFGAIDFVIESRKR